jgi:Spy/CpxP family protein refolding chaperone
MPLPPSRCLPNSCHDMMTAPGKWKVAAYLTAIFAAGMVSGWVVAGREAKTKPQTPPPPGRVESGPRGKPSIYQVDLDPDQKTTIDEIMRKYGKKWDELRSQQGTQMRQDSSNRNNEISKVLRPEQREQWKKLREEREHGGPRRPKRTEGANADNGRGVTNGAGAQSTSPVTPSAPQR